MQVTIKLEIAKLPGHVAAEDLTKDLEKAIQGYLDKEGDGGSAMCSLEDIDTDED